MSIRVGSVSPLKLAAVKDACKILGWTSTVSCLNATSGQNDQPVGFQEIWNGAYNRASKVKSCGGNYLYVGIENGIIEVKKSNSRSITLDIAVVVVITSENQVITTTSPCFELPQKYVKIARKRGFDRNTVGSVISEKLGGSADDPHHKLSGGKISRQDLLIDALIRAFQQTGYDTPDRLFIKR